MKNVEIKAKVDNIDKVEEKAKELSDSPLVVIEQHDIFFHVPSNQAARGGRLKLRQFKVKIFIQLFMYFILFTVPYRLRMAPENLSITKDQM